MKIGLLARADNGGLGVQTKEFYDHIKPYKTLMVDISSLNGNKIYPERFNAYAKTKGFLTRNEIEEFLKDIDLLFTCEIPYNYELFSRAKELGVKSVLQPNYEFNDYLVQDLPFPDMFALPSLWHYDDIMAKFGNKTKVVYLPVPVNREKLPFEEKKQAKKFLHIAGTLLHEDRNGTEIVKQAIPLIKSDIELVVAQQANQVDPSKIKIPENVKLTIRKPQKEYWEVYQDEDILVLPRRYGGLSLQLNEAMSKGMIPIMTNIDPQNKFLHERSLVEPKEYKTTMTRTEIDVWSITPEDLAHKIDEFANMPEKDIRELSRFSDEYASRIDWTNMKAKYLKEFNEI